MSSQTSLLTPGRLSFLLPDLLERGRDAAVLVAVSHPVPEGRGRRMLVSGDQERGTFQDHAADRQAVELARRGLGGDPAVESGLYTLTMEDGEEMEVFLELHHPRPELIIVGAGHVARPLCTLGHLLGLRVTVLDDRPEFATRERFPEAAELADVDFRRPFQDRTFHPWTHLILVTRGHRFDYECLRRVLSGDALPGFIGMIGSRRRVRATFQALLEEGIPRDRLARVHSPIGLDLGAETPEEIAVSVAAELVHHWRGGSGQPLREVASVLERFLPEPNPATPPPDDQEPSGRETTDRSSGNPGGSRGQFEEED